MIEVQNLSHDIHGAPILRDISVTVPKGGVVALVGPNGAGKSTLLSLMARLIPRQQGRITVDELVVGESDDKDLARRLAILPQTVHAASRLTVRDLVGFGRYPYHRGRPTPDDRAMVEDGMRLFDLLPLAERSLDTLSGGQRQRAFVAMTYVQDTDYLLLDEPLNNLDLAASRALMARLRDLADNKDRTVIIVLHDINFATAYADRVLVMKEGRLCADGAPQDVITETLIQSVFETDAPLRTVEGRPVVMV
ncbi:ATP-binding cassette domain-containing protein [Epibacterium sp. DP7N7-1]|uniref:iron ABC transporter ATP-binding protein n=1 Tax=Tritonibacter mobilis TaxID=379347 RepID=UPI000806EBCB|nr:ATP-binding cassette domain-containing protein [Tritonibacter mobilis]MBW3242053.1 ATP-binding cassette domain-containing protein [Epibacterium sp. DP7N7-1]MEE2809855.1 ATP-binding cassette domain-containing protein [Pseudomonadota bacterium]NKX36670.1 ATP-binding cassette domain-containing protein [Rhodobacteraceae bacterium R_SAG4]